MQMPRHYDCLAIMMDKNLLVFVRKVNVFWFRKCMITPEPTHLCEDAC